MPNLSLSQLIASTVIGSAGFVLFVYGRKQGEWKPLAAGVVLMLFPVVVQETLPLCLGSVLVMAALHVFRD